MPSLRQHSFLCNLQNLRLFRSRKYCRLKSNWCLPICLLGFLFTLYLIISQNSVHPTAIPAQSDQIVTPRHGEDVLSFAHEYAEEQNLPVYIMYKARSGQLNNQLTSFFNALVIAKQANATLVAPFTFHGFESYADFRAGKSFIFNFYQAFDTYVYQSFLRLFGLQYRYDELVGDYIDGTLLNKRQPVVSIVDFKRSVGGKHLSAFPCVLTRKGDARYFYMTLGKRSLLGRNINIRGKTIDGGPDVTESPASRKELDCNFNVSEHFRGLQFNVGVNGNYLFLSKLYRSHSLNCTSANPYWLEVRRFVQPRVEIRELVAAAMGRWGKVVTVHLRFFPFDQNKFLARNFCSFFLSHFQHQIREADHVYIAFSISSKESLDILSRLRQILGRGRVITAHDYGNLHTKGPAFSKRYAVPLVDMWTSINSHYFVGRLGSSLSWNVVYWRQSFRRGYMGQFHDFYRLSNFSTTGDMNPTDSYGF